MLFSCKISNSILTHLGRSGEDLEGLYDHTDLPAEFLRDPSYWLEAEKMESLLTYFQQQYSHISETESLFTLVGHQTKDLRSWGVLDSVLRMFGSPQEIYSQPERFLSYFVSPAPPIGRLRRQGSVVQFDVPISSSQYPRVTEFLAAAMEALPLYGGKQMASVKWIESTVRIDWSEDQQSLLGQDYEARSLHPDLLKNILSDLERSQKQLEETRLLLLVRDREISELKAEAEKIKTVASLQTLSTPSAGSPARDNELLSHWARVLNHEVMSPAQWTLNHIYRLNDYMARAQQLITILIGQGRHTPQVQEAMRRVDWAFVQGETPKVVRQAVGGIKRMQDILKDVELMARIEVDEQSVLDEPRVKSNINQIVGRAIESVSASLPSGSEIQIDQQFLLDREVPIYRTKMEHALCHLLFGAVQGLRGRGHLKVVTRSHGKKAQIEISDAAVALSTHAPQDLFSLASDRLEMDVDNLSFNLAQSIVKLHHGSLVVHQPEGQSATVVVDLPV